MLDELGYVFAEERERRIGNDDIRFIQKTDALLRPEVAVSIQRDLPYVAALRVAIPAPPPSQENSMPTAVSES